MKINAIKTLLAVLLLALASGPAAAAGGASNLEPSGINVNDTASLQRGAKMFVKLLPVLPRGQLHAVQAPV